MLCRTDLIFPLTNRLADSILKNIMVVGLEIMKSANFIEYPPPIRYNNIDIYLSNNYSVPPIY